MSLCVGSRFLRDVGCISPLDLTQGCGAVLCIVHHPGEHGYGGYIMTREIINQPLRDVGLLGVPDIICGFRFRVCFLSMALFCNTRLEMGG